MGLIVDSSVFIAIERAELSDSLLAHYARDEEVAMAAITASELLQGVHRARSDKQLRAREAFVERLLTNIPIFDFDLVAARAHARLCAQLSTKGALLGVHDLLIAATALAHGFRVITRDKRSFPKIPHLDIALV